MLVQVQVLVRVMVMVQVVMAQCQRARCAWYQGVLRPPVLRPPGGLRCCSEILLLPIVSPREESVVKATYRSCRCY